MKNLILTLTSMFIAITLNGQNIHQTACQGNIARLDSLLGDTTNINILDKHGRSILHYSVACNQEKVFDYLIDRGIDINIKENIGWTPLLLAVKQNKEKFVEKLLEMEAKANFNHANQDGTSILMEAVLNDNLPQAKLLIENGANVNAVNKRGSTPLGIARRDELNEMIAFLVSKGADKESAPMPELKGKYLGQEKPDLTAKMFAPNFISTENFVHNGVFHPNGKEFYYTIETRRYNGGTIMVSKLDGKKWSKPEPTSIPGTFREVGPFISKDGSKLYYSSDRPVNESDTIGSSLDLWMLEREGDKWGPPIHLGREVNSDGNDWFPTISDNGRLYFYMHKDRSGNIFYAENKNGKYQKAILIEGVDNGKYYNYDPFIAPDESYVIFASRDRPDGLGSSDLYISFKKDQATWSQPKNMGEGVNTSKSEYAPILTPDGKYLFFARGYGDVFWVDSQIIENLK